LTDAQRPRQAPTPESLEGAEAELGEIRRLLAAAGRGQVSVTDLQAALQRYLDRNGEALRDAAWSVGEQLRTRMIEELYRWRAQLQSQLPSGPPTGSDTSAADQPQERDDSDWTR
jgi:hypothetical protein